MRRPASARRPSDGPGARRPRGAVELKDNGGRRGRARPAHRRTSSAGRRGSGRREDAPEPSTSCSSTRPARCRSPTSLAVAPSRARPSSCSAIRSSSTSRLQGTHPPGAERSALRTSSAADGDDARRPRACSSSTTWRLHPDLCDVHVARSSTRAGSSRAGPRAPAPRRAASAGPRRARARARSPVAHAGARHRVAGGGRRRSRSSCARSSRRSRLDRPRRRRERLVTVDDVLIVAPYNAQVGADRAAALPAGRRASAPSTSSRARRRRSASTR